MYIAIIGDIISSKKLEDREEVQEKLNIILDEINNKYDNYIESKFLITLGDEFQGLLLNPVKLFEIIDTIKFKMYPVKIRFGIGIGSINTKINRSMALGADGPCYHYARDVIEELKMLNKKNSKANYSTDIKLSAHFNTNIESLINANLSMLYYIEDRWTIKQRELVQKKLFHDKTQRELADELNVNQSSIQRGLKGAGYYDYIYVKNTVEEVLNKVWGENNAD